MVAYKSYPQVTAVLSMVASCDLIYTPNGQRVQSVERGEENELIFITAEGSFILDKLMVKADDFKRIY